MSERETNSAISKVEGEIEKVAAQIEKVEKQLENKSLPKDEIDYLRKREEQLRKEKEQLRKKEEQLRKEKEQLREKEILILQQQQEQQINLAQMQMQTQQVELLKVVAEEVNKARKSRLNCWERDSLRTTGSKRDQKFRQKVIRYYQRESSSGKSVKCQILDEYVSHDNAKEAIIASHIWKAETRGRFLDEFGLCQQDINHARNGMFLTKGIEEAFDNQQVCFLYNIITKDLCLWVADKSILSETIVGSNPQKTFHDIHQKPLLCPDKEEHIPYRRLLSWHARLTLELRKENIRVPDQISEYDLSPGRACGTMDPISRAIDDLVEPGEDASVKD